MLRFCLGLFVNLWNEKTGRGDFCRDYCRNALFVWTWYSNWTKKHYFQSPDTIQFIQLIII